MSHALLNIIAHDGSRQFGELPQSVSWNKLRRHIKRLDGVTDVSLLTDNVIEGWIDFNFRGHDFSVNNQFGDYWFFVKDPQSPDDVLETVLSHCRNLLGDERQFALVD